jgi:hypothetical protein
MQRERQQKPASVTKYANGNQTAPGTELNFGDPRNFNLPGYRLDRLKQKVSPPSPDAWNQQPGIVRGFDQLICNTGRNLVIEKQQRIWMINHTRAFRGSKDLREPRNLARCDRALLDKRKGLTEPDLSAALEHYLTRPETRALLVRQDRAALRKTRPRGPLRFAPLNRLTCVRSTAIPPESLC